MKGFLPTVTLGTARAPSVPCSARAITIAGLGLGAIVGAVDGAKAATIRITASAVGLSRRTKNGGFRKGVAVGL